MALTASKWPATSGRIALVGSIIAGKAVWAKALDSPLSTASVPWLGWNWAVGKGVVDPLDAASRLPSPLALTSDRPPPRRRAVGGGRSQWYGLILEMVRWWKRLTLDRRGVLC